MRQRCRPLMRSSSADASSSISNMDLAQALCSADASGSIATREAWPNKLHSRCQQQHCTEASLEASAQQMSAVAH